MLDAPNKAGGGFPAFFGDGAVLAVPDYSALKTCDVSSGAAYTFSQPHRLTDPSADGELFQQLVQTSS